MASYPTPVASTPPVATRGVLSHTRGVRPTCPPPVASYPTPVAPTPPAATRGVFSHTSGVHPVPLLARRALRASHYTFRYAHEDSIRPGSPQSLTDCFTGDRLTENPQRRLAIDRRRGVGLQG